MKRVLVLGCGGAGKSTLARLMGDRLGLPVIHLDQHYWRPGWIEPSKEEWQVQAAALAEGPEWIIDGNYTVTIGSRFAVADTAVMIDFPTWRCLWRVLKRIAASYGRTRPDLAEGCPEHVDLKFFRYVLGYRRNSRPRHMALFEGFSGRKIHLRTPAEVRAFVDGLDGPLQLEGGPS